MPAGIIQLALFCLIILALTPLAGGYMHRVFAGERTLLSPLLAPLERVIYRICRIHPAEGHRWTRYAFAVLILNAFGWLLLYAILRLQHLFPFNPAGLPPLTPDLAFNTAVSFVTNTNWQAYSGEAALSYFSQMAGLTVQNFLSAATGMAVAAAIIRGFAGSGSRALGNFYADLTRAVLYILLPLSVLAALALVWQGVPQNLDPYATVTTLEGGTQTIAQGPAASQIAIKQLGTNGGGFFNANSAHPYENPTPLTNLIQLIYILLIPAAFCYTFGKMAGDIRQGWAIFAAMAVMFLAGLSAIYWAEASGNPLFAQAPIDQAAGNMEGKEVRFGVANSAAWAAATTAASNGSVNSMHDSFTPLGGLVALLNMQLGEIIFGGAGSGLYGMLLFAVLTVFIAGLMVGRTPEYLGKKIEAKEVKLAMFALLSLPLAILGASALAVLIPAAAVSPAQDAGPHAFSAVLYAYSSAAGNNGSAFGGFTSNTPYHNTALGVCMLIGRYAVIVPMLAIAGSLAAKKTVPVSAGTFPTHTPLFVTLLVIVILVIGALTFFPALALGPIAEHFAMQAGRTY